MKTSSVIFILYCLAAVRHSTSPTIRFRKFDVEECPQQQSTWNEAASRLNCSVDKHGHNTYHCVPEQDKSSLVEFCYDRLVGRFEEGYCIHLSSTGFLNNENCSGILPGCPKESYLSNEIFKYPDCQNINTNDRCFVADLTCPNKFRYYSTANSTMKLLLSNGTTSIPYPENEWDILSIPWIVGSTVFITFLVLVVLLYLYKARKRFRNILV